MIKPTIKVDIVSDVVCPWCYIGKRRIEKAMNVLKDKYNFELEYHPFELNTELPKEGTDQKAYLAAKFGGEDRYRQLTANVVLAAAQEGLKFDFEKQAIMPNTREAHRIIQFAKHEGVQPAVKEAFMKAYFEDGVDLSKKENLVAVAVQAGLAKDKVEALLATDAGLAQVAQAERELQKLGISGVPFYIINNEFGISGAQASETFVQAFENIVAEKSKTNAAGEACDVESKNC